MVLVLSQQLRYSSPVSAMPEIELPDIDLLAKAIVAEFRPTLNSLDGMLLDVTNEAWWASQLDRYADRHPGTGYTRLNQRHLTRAIVRLLVH